MSNVEEDNFRENCLARKKMTLVMSRACGQCAIKCCEELPIQTKDSDVMKGQVNYGDLSDPGDTQLLISRIVGSEQNPSSIPNICRRLNESGLRNDGKWQRRVLGALHSLISNEYIVVDDSDEDKIKRTQKLEEISKT